ncbi:MAG: ABC transporter ATP-binding protein [Acidimicrobiales bacterium]
MSGLQAVGIEKAYGAQPVLRGLDLACPPGSTTVLLGPSGSGKTTLLRILAGFEQPDAGEVSLDGVVLQGPGARVPPEHRRVGYLPQEGALFPHMSVERNVGFALRKVGRAQRRREVERLLEMVGLASTEKRYPHELSGGQQQRVALARALAASPKAMLLDEPFASLDPELRASVRGEVLELLRASGTTTLLVTHDQQEALACGDRVAVLLQGTIVQVSDPRDLYLLPASPEVATFLGTANLLAGTTAGSAVRTVLGMLEAALDGSLAGRDALVVVRPEQIELVSDGAAAWGRVLSVEYFGHDMLVRVSTEGAEGPCVVVARVKADRAVEVGARVGLRASGAVTAWAGTRVAAGASVKNTAM